MDINQRLTKLIGRARAMDLILTGRMIDAHEADKIGLISRLVDTSELENITLETAGIIANYAKDITSMAILCDREAEELSLNAGIKFERQMYYALYGTPTQKEGMAAFMEKRDPQFNR